MADQLYALQMDLDMVVQDVQELKRSYNLLDYIAKVVRNCEIEQVAQAAQMRRIEERLDAMEKNMKLEFRKIHSTLALITKHLGINDK